MIPYDLIVTASHRPALLEPTLTSLLAQVDQPPARILIHDDAVPPGGFRAQVRGRWRTEAIDGEEWPVWQPALPTLHVDELAEARAATQRALLRLNPPMPVVYTWSDPPRKMGLALRWLLDNAQTEYVLYSQDDHVVVRPLPIQRALEVMAVHALHQIRFNKRATLAFKDTWQGRWHKVERDVIVLGPGDRPYTQRLTVSDHFYFQTGLWRRAPIQAAVHWATATPVRRGILRQGVAEEALNAVLDGRCGPVPGVETPPGTAWPPRANPGQGAGPGAPLQAPEDRRDPPGDPPAPPAGGRAPVPPGVDPWASPAEDDPAHPGVRVRYQRTYIWGPIGEDRYVRHIGGGAPRGDHPRDGGTDDPARAWREIRGYGKIPLAGGPGAPYTTAEHEESGDGGSAAPENAS